MQCSWLAALVQDYSIKTAKILLVHKGVNLLEKGLKELIGSRRSAMALHFWGADFVNI